MAVPRAGTAVPAAWGVPSRISRTAARRGEGVCAADGPRGCTLPMGKRGANRRFVLPDERSFASLRRIHRVTSQTNRTELNRVRAQQVSGSNVCGWSTGAMYEQHITGDVAMAFRQQYYLTRNASWLSKNAWPVIRGAAVCISLPPSLPPSLPSHSLTHSLTHSLICSACVCLGCDIQEFWASRFVLDTASGNYTIKAVTGPDESSGKVDDEA